MGHYIVATLTGPEDPERYEERQEQYRPPIQAPSPEEAISRRGVVPEDCLEVYVYPVKETPAGNCKVFKVKEEEEPINKKE